MVDVVNLDSTVRHINTDPGTPTKDFFNWLKKVSDFGAPWTAYKPTVSAQSGTITSYTSSARYKEIGKTVLLQIQINITNAGTAGGYIAASLPKAAVPGQIYMISGRETAVTGNALIGQVAGATVGILTYNNASPAVTGWQLNLGGSYEEI
jgi:hypothetical protein